MAKGKLASDYVFDALMNLISAYEYGPGDRLPSENALAEEYDVSRVTIRAALNKLAALGFIESRVGGGWYVKKFNFSFITDITSKFMVTNVSKKDITQYRLLIEVEALKNLKDQQIKDADIKYLKSCCSRMEKALKEDDNPRKHAIADYDFHRRICKMSGNSLYLYSYDMLYSLLVQYYEHRMFNEAENVEIDINTVVKGHQYIIDCIIDNKIEKAIEIENKMALSSPKEFIDYIKTLGRKGK